LTLTAFDLQGDIKNRRVRDNLVDKELAASRYRAVKRRYQWVTGFCQYLCIIELLDYRVGFCVGLKEKSAPVGKNEKSVNRVQGNGQRTQFNRCYV
jgi:hypothetical protein